MWLCGHVLVAGGFALFVFGWLFACLDMLLVTCLVFDCLRLAV